MIRLAVFLGNPGPKYAHNRHNAAWMLANVLPFSSSLNWEKKFGGLFSCSPSVGIHFLKPQTYMNRSGGPALAAAVFYKIKTEEIIVIHDEIELPFGTVSLKFSGGLGGHNGLRSMKACFGSVDFWRLRLGIGRPDGRIPGKGGSLEGFGIADWVLSDFSPVEEEAFAVVLAAGADLLLQAIEDDPDKLLPQWGRKNILEKQDNIHI